MAHENRRAIEAIARAKFRNDPTLRKLAAEEGVSIDAAAAEYAASLYAATGAASPTPPAINGEKTAVAVEDATDAEPSSVPEGILRVLKETGPVTRQHVYQELLQRGWMKPVDDPNKIIGNAVHRLMKRGKIIEFSGPKPRKIALSPSNGGP